MRLKELEVRGIKEELQEQLESLQREIHSGRNNLERLINEGIVETEKMRRKS